MDPKWIEWARKLQALAQSGLAYTQSPFEIERYNAIRAVAAEMMAAGAESEVKPIRELFAQQLGYATPKVDVRGVVFDGEGRILLVKELRDGRYTLPGGWADVGDTPAEAAVREVFEETGFQTRAVKLLAVWDRRKHGHTPAAPFHLYKIFIRCELLGGAAKDSAETEGAAFFAEEQLPALELSLSRTTPSQLARLFEHLRNPDLPTDFD